MDEWERRQSLRGHGRDEGYAERFHNHIQGQSLWRARLLEVAIGFFLILGLSGALATGYLREAVWGLFVAAFIGVLIWGWRAIAKIRRQDRMHNEAFERQSGIDRRFGRLGADRK